MPTNDIDVPQTTPTHIRRLGWAALLLALAAASLAGVRTITAEDIGYHLAFGEEFWTNGRLVDHCEFIYTLPPASPQAHKPAPGPGCWYDAQGRYRFPNANWLTQVIFYGAWSVGGVAGLNLLLAMCVLGLFVLLAAACLRAGGGPLAAAVVVLLAVMTTYPRMLLRPELLGYLALLGKVAILAPLLASVQPDVKLSRRALIGVVLLQLVYVNLHSYWMLSLAVTGASLLLPLAAVLRSSQDVGQKAPALAALRQRGGLLLVQLAVCFVNPWTWRLVVLPAQTLVYLRQHMITGVLDETSPHPWNAMEDMRRTLLLPADPAADIAGTIFVLVFAIMVLAGLVMLFRKRWGGAAVVLGMLLVAFSAQRNQAVGVLAGLPLAVAALGSALGQRPGGKRRRLLLAGGTLGVAGLAVLVGILFVGSTLYRNDAYKMRFGHGFSREVVPVGVAELLNAHGPAGPLWATPRSTSNLYFLVRPHPPIQMITNTWAYPPATMAEVFGVAETGTGDELADRWGVSIAAITPGEMFLALRDDPNWAMIGLADGHGVFVRRDGPDRGLARKAMAPDAIDAETIIQRWAGHPDGHRRLLDWGELLAYAGFLDAAVDIAEAAVPLSPQGSTSARVRAFRIRILRARARLIADDSAAIDDYEAAERLLETMGASAETRKAVEAEKEAAAAKFRHGGQ
jgi:hypothetical protein